MTLNDKQEMFCKEYLVDLNATQAAIRAGYSERSARSQGQRLLTKVDIIARVKELKDARANELQLDAYWVLKRLKDVSDRSMQAEPVMVFNPETKSLEESGEYEFDSQGANRSTELIGRHIGMFDPKLQHQLRLMDVQIEKSKAEVSKLKGEDLTEFEDDGFLDAINQSADIWDDEDE